MDGENAGIAGANTCQPSSSGMDATLERDG